MAGELKKLTGRVQSIEGGTSVEGLNYEDVCIQPDVELPEGYKPPMFEMFDGTGDPKNPKTWANWVSMVSDFMDRFRFNTENTPDIFYVQNLKKNQTETFCEYATRWRSEVAMVRPPLEQEKMNKFFVRGQDPLYYERLMVIENYKFSDIIKLG
ncbi:uncharacterized protein [Nicotiana tomentosiformis]|uniref:uncharacterized protein n=1 Tax=Nicotiana tomentosiformis TaxID=4098 RepID=UPI00388C5617